jgi:hypothetical protein
LMRHIACVAAGRHRGTKEEYEKQHIMRAKWRPWPYKPSAWPPRDRDAERSSRKSNRVLAWSSRVTRAMSTVLPDPQAWCAAIRPKVRLTNGRSSRS